MRFPSLLLFILTPFSTALARSIHGHRHQHSPRIANDQRDHNHAQKHIYKHSHMHSEKDETSAIRAYKPRHVPSRGSKTIHCLHGEDRTIELKPISEGFVRVEKTKNRGKQEEDKFYRNGEKDIKNINVRALDEIFEREEKSGLIMGRYVKNGIGRGDIVVVVMAGLMVAGAFLI